MDPHRDMSRPKTVPACQYS